MELSDQANLIARSLTAARLRAEPDTLAALCARALAEGGAHALAMTADLQRRAATLEAVAPKLRSKAAGAAVGLFLREDAVTPVVHLTPRVRGTSVAMTDRSARRLCDRLVALRAVRELTGRAQSRLYGL